MPRGGSRQVSLLRPGRVRGLLGGPDGSAVCVRVQSGHVVPPWKKSWRHALDVYLFCRFLGASSGE
eukprot:228998-Pyramimonas_sp.AAC.1